jgi:zinc protease
MKMEADRMEGLLFPPDQVKSERLVVIEERRSRTEDDPRGYFAEQLRNALFVNHPYAHPVIGWLQEMNALERENVKKFYDTWYAPNNAILVFSGDVTAAQVKPLAEKIYGPLPRKAIPERRWTQVPTLLANEAMTLRHPAVRQSEFYRIYRVPGMIESRQDALALEVLEDIMDGSAATRLYKSLVVDQKIATSAGMSYNPGSRSDSILWLSAVPAAGVTPEQIGKAFDAELAKLVEKGVTDKELAEAKARLKDEAVFQRDSLSQPATLFGETLAIGGTMDDVEYWPAHIDSVTAAQVQDVAKRFLDPADNHNRPSVSGYLLLSGDAKEGGAPAALPVPVGGPVR